MTRGGERHSIQIRLFGAAGQQRLAAASIVLIGLGGLGSHLAQQLAHLGVRRYILIDGDTVDTNGLSGLIGATRADVGLLRTDVAARLIRGIEPTAEVRVVRGSLPCALLDAGAAVGSAAAVVAGLDERDVLRFLLTELCSIPGVPYVNAASGVLLAGSDVIYGGRVVVAGPAAGCLFCRGEFNRREDASARAERRGPGAGGGSVVTIDGVVASLAAMEIACLISGLRPPFGMLTYRADQGVVTRNVDPSGRHCPYCARWASRRQRAPDG